MKQLYFVIFILISMNSLGQILTDEDYDIFHTITCNEKNKDLKIESACVYSIRKFDFYQDSVSLSEVSYPNDRIRIGHKMIIEYYDRVPYQIIKEYLEIDTTLLNPSFDTKKSSELWEEGRISCENVKIKNSDRFNKRTYRFFRPITKLFSGKKFTLISHPIYLISQDHVIIQKVYYRFGNNSKRRSYIKTLYYLQRIEDGWEIVESFVYDGK